MNRYRKHQNLLNEIKLEVQKEFPNVRIFDRHVGLFYTAHGAPVKINKKGMADLYLLYSSPMVPALFHIEIEVKSGQARQSKAQKDWQNFIESMNGIYIVARSPDDVISELNRMNFPKGEIKRPETSSGLN